MPKTGWSGGSRCPARLETKDEQTKRENEFQPSLWALGRQQASADGAPGVTTTNGRPGRPAHHPRRMRPPPPSWAWRGTSPRKGRRPSGRVTMVAAARSETPTVYLKWCQLKEAERLGRECYSSHQRCCGWAITADPGWVRPVRGRGPSPSSFPVVSPANSGR